MAKRNKTRCGVIVTLLLIFIISNTFAYVFQSTRPTKKTLQFFMHDSLGQASQDAAIYAAGTWNAVPNAIIFTKAGYSTGEIRRSDNRSDIATTDFKNLYYDGVSTSATGVCIVSKESNYSNFDIYLDTTDTWGNGDSSNYLDRQGNFTHEFGHAAGLDHNSSTPGNASPDRVSPSDYQTMFPNVYDALGRNLTYHWRTLHGDDISGVQAVAAKIN